MQGRSPQPRCLALAGQQIAYQDRGVGRRTFLFVHGNPVNSHVFDRLIARLAGNHRCVAPDLIGFGSSSKPTGERAYSLPLHINTVAGLVRELDLRRVVLVVHDWGGPIGLAAALREPERYTHLVILNTMTLPVMRIAPVYQLPFRLFRLAPGMFSWLVRRLNFFQRMGVGIMEPADKALFLQANGSPAARAGIAAFPKMIPHRADHPTAPLLESILRRAVEWQIPSLVIFSDHDSVFSLQEGRAFAASLADSKFVAIRGPRHFLQYEQPDRVAGAIKQFLNTRSEL